MGYLSGTKTMLSLAILSALVTSQAALADESGNIEKITVMGEKNRRSMQDTAASVDVTTALKLEQENIQSLYDILNKTPNISQMYGNRGFTIRGISSESGADNPLASIYMDDVPLPSQISDTGPSDLWDVAQVEVLRGPQSTIQGENALAGAVVIKTEDPTMDWSGRARVQWSNPDDKRMSIAVGGPLIDDELAFRFAADKRLFEGFTDNITRGGTEDELNSLMLRGKLLWTPKAVDGLKVLLSYTRDDRDGPYMFTYNQLDLPGRVNTSNHENRSDAVTDLASLNVNYQLNDYWQFSSVTSYSKSDVDRVYDVDLRAEDSNYGTQTNNYKVFTQELRANYQGEALSGLLGLYAAKHDNHSLLSTLSNLDTPVTTIATLLQGYGLDSGSASTVATLYGAALPQIPVDYLSLNDSTSENQALFADMEYRLNSRWSLQAGFRYDHQQYRFSSDTDSRFAGVLPDPTLFGADGSLLYQLVGGINSAVLGLVAQASGSSPETTTTTDTFLPKIGARFNIDDNTSITATYQRAYRSGGSSLNIARSSVVAYDPEYTDNYELAWRQSLPSIDGVFNANLYYVNWKDKQVTANFGLNSYDYNTVNAGKAHLYGIEMSFKQQLTADIDGYLSYSYSRTKFDQFDSVMNGTTTSYAGEEFSYAPNHTVAAGVNVYFTDHLSWNLNANYRSKVYTDMALDRTRVSSRTLVNTRLAYDNGDWSTYLFANNLFDQDYVQYLRDDVDAISGAPRVIGIGAELRW